MASAYVEDLRKKEIERYDAEMKVCNFRKEYKSQIENGLTLGQFRSTHQTTQEDERLFRQIAEEVDWERREGEAFMKGFNSVGGYGR